MQAAIQGRALMAPYLPRNGASGSPYSEGGALYALGLTYANHGHDVKDFLLQSLRETASEVLLLPVLHLPLGTSRHCFQTRPKGVLDLGAALSARRICRV